MGVFMIDIVNHLNNYLWNYCLIYLLLSAGVYGTLRTRFIQIRHFFTALKTLIAGRKESKDSGGISSFQALCTSLAAQVGTSNIVGVALAIEVGGPGAVFWMWLVAILGMATSYVENTLAQVYKVDNGDGTFRGGPAYYIEKALGLRWLALAFSVCLVLTFGFAFNAVQSNSVVTALMPYSHDSTWGVSIFLAFAAFLVIVKGIKGIAKIAELIIPVMVIIYLSVTGVVITVHWSQLAGLFSLILTSAFDFKMAAAGGFGYMVSQAISEGVKRGLLSNEAGMGSTPNAAATATAIPNHPSTQGLVSMFSIFVDTIIICSSTAFIILLSGEYVPGSGEISGIGLTQKALTASIGGWGHGLVSLVILLFGFSSIIANYYYGETSLRLICNNQKLIRLYQFCVFVVVVWGGTSAMPLVWAIADLSMGLMAILNLVTITLLSSIAFALLKDFERTLNAGGIPKFDVRMLPILEKTVDTNVWPLPKVSRRYFSKGAHFE